MKIEMSEELKAVIFTLNSICPSIDWQCTIYESYSSNTILVIGKTNPLLLSDGFTDICFEITETDVINDDQMLDLIKKSIQEKADFLDECKEVLLTKLKLLDKQNENK